MKLLHHLAVVAARRRLARSTVDAYSSWIRQFLTFHRAADGTWRHPAPLGTARRVGRNRLIGSEGRVGFSGWTARKQAIGRLR